MRGAIAIAIAIALLAAIGCKRDEPAPQAQPAPRTFSKLDVHTHFGPRAADHTVALMDQFGIELAVNLSGGSPGNGLEQQLAAATAHPGRIIVFATLDWSVAQSGPGYGVAMAAQLERAHALGARGLKISKGLGIGYTDQRGELIAVDAAELDLVFDKAGALGMPVAIHTGDPVAFWQPPTAANERYAELSVHPEWSFYGGKVPSWSALVDALERRIARHPGTTFIAVHFGNAPEYPDRVRRMLETYPNMMIDTAARVPEIGRHPPEAMRQLFIDFSDRILFGTDLGVGTAPMDLMLGSTGDRPPTQADVDHFFASTWRYFETADKGFAHPTPIQGNWTISGIDLPDDVLEKLYAGNARRILGL